MEVSQISLGKEVAGIDDNHVFHLLGRHGCTTATLLYAAGNISIDYGKWLLDLPQPIADSVTSADMLVAMASLLWIDSARDAATEVGAKFDDTGLQSELNALLLSRMEK